MSAEEICRCVYGEVRKFYSEKRAMLGDAARGVTILYGPPILNSPIFFIGEQPGDHGNEDPGTLPVEFAYATANWAMARKVRRVWGLPIIQECTGLNVNFFHAPSRKHWDQVPEPLRIEIEDFCRERTIRMARALQPRKIVIIGSRVFDRLCVGGTVLMSPTRNRVLLKRGELRDLPGIPTFGVIHLTGARPNNRELHELASYFSNLTAT